MRRPFSRHEASARHELIEPPEATMSRRSFLRKTRNVGALGLSLAAADTLAGEFIWAGTQPEVRTFPNPEAQKQFPGTHTMVIGGFGVWDVKAIAESVDICLSDYGQVAYLHNSNEGLHMGDIKREARRFIKENDVELLRLYGHSMGGMIATELAAELTDEVEIEAIFLDCSPASYRDVRDDERIGSWILDACDELSLHLGPAARFGIETLRPLLDGRDDYLEICRHALSKLSADNCSNALLQGQASYLRAFNVSDYAGTIPDSTHIIRLRPDDYNADGTVNNETSLPRWQNGLDHFVHDAVIRGGGHASSKNHTKEYARVLQQAAKMHQFYDGSVLE